MLNDFTGALYLRLKSWFFSLTRICWYLDIYVRYRSALLARCTAARRAAICTFVDQKGAEGLQPDALKSKRVDTFTVINAPITILRYDPHICYLYFWRSIGFRGIPSD